MEKKTPLYDRHVALGGKIVPFAGWLLPVQYGTGVIAEHRAVRTGAGLFDVSHMGDVFVEGEGAEASLNRLLTNRFDGMPDGTARYSLMLQDDGGTVDDLIVYRYDPVSFFIIVNAANKDKDVAWMRDHIGRDTLLTDLSDNMAQIALQGPRAAEILSRIADPALLPAKYYTFAQSVPVAGVPCMVASTGYTGERGYELVLSPGNAGIVWDALVENGAVPCGLGARDTLRLEAAMPLYGHELSETIDPYMAGLGFAVCMDKPDFIGKGALEAKKTPSHVRAGLRATGRGVLREHQDVVLNGEKIGETTSGTFCPTIGAACAMAYLDREYAAPGTAVDVDVRGRLVGAEVVTLPFYRRGS